jgi:DNA recombination protein RmuC
MDILVVITLFLIVVVSLIATIIKNKHLAVENIKLTTQLQEREKQTQFLQHDFKRISSEVLNKDTQLLNEKNKDLLSPLKKDIENFKTRIEDLNTAQSNERTALKKQIELLEKSNKEILTGAQDLTNALVYDNKTQGDWGEVQLELILQGSGLKEGNEYHKQQAKRNTKGSLYKPDFIVNLPNNKDIIIDSKVSLKEYKNYVAGDENALKNHLKSIQNHINSISLKAYESLEEVHTLDFIFVFFPIEASLLVALEQDPELFNNAIKKNVALVSPSTLMMSLKVVSHIWDIEKQNKNTEEIVRLAGNMCDKFYGFVESIDDVNKNLDKAKESYNKAKNRLSEGRGNAIKIAEDIQTLGVKTKKQLQ